MSDRSTAVFIGWCYVSLAAVSLAAGVFSGGSLSWMQGVLRKEPGIIDEFPGHYRLVLERLDLMYAFLGLEIVISAGLIAVAAGFLRFRAWARTGLEYVNWFGILFSTEVLLVSAAAWTLGRTGVLIRLVPAIPSAAFSLMHLALIPACWLLAAGPLFLVNRFIRRPDIRVLFQEPAPSNIK